MKVKLKKGEKLSYLSNHSGLSIQDWTALNQGNQVELNSIPNLIKDKLEKINSKKKDKK